VTSSNVRYILAAIILGYAFGIIPPLNGPVNPVGPYRGPYPKIHQAARSMDFSDRKALSEAFKYAGEMLGNDKKDLIDTTAEAQDFAFAVLEYDYQTIGQPKRSYPDVADAISDALEDEIGTEKKALSSSDKRDVVEMLGNISEAVK